MLRIFIGFDPRETVAYHVLSHSIMKRASEPVSITPLSLATLAGVFNRERDPLQSTDFAFTRFLVPHLCNYSGLALFMDCDMLVRCDIAELFDMARRSPYTVTCVKHRQKPREDVKFLGAKQTSYARKNWSSLMMFNCYAPACSRLTPQYVASASGLELHQMQWANGSAIGEFPREYNHLVGHDEPNPDAKIVHYTLGGPYFNEYIECEYAQEWILEKLDMLRCDQTTSA